MAALAWAPDDEIVVQLAKDLLTARQDKDRAAQRRYRRAAEVARTAAWVAEQRAIAVPSHENVTNAFARQLVVAALALVDDPAWVASVAA